MFDARNQNDRMRLNTSVVEWVIEHPEAETVFQELGIDYCCDGKSLAYVCHQQGLDGVAVLEKIQTQARLKSSQSC